MSLNIFNLLLQSSEMLQISSFITYWIVYLFLVDFNINNTLGSRILVLVGLFCFVFFLLYNWWWSLDLFVQEHFSLPLRLRRAFASELDLVNLNSVLVEAIEIQTELVSLKTYRQCSLADPENIKRIIELHNSNVRLGSQLKLLVPVQRPHYTSTEVNYIDTINRAYAVVLTNSALSQQVLYSNVAALPDLISGRLLKFSISRFEQPYIPREYTFGVVDWGNDNYFVSATQWRVWEQMDAELIRYDRYARPVFAYFIGRTYSVNKYYLGASGEFFHMKSPEQLSYLLGNHRIRLTTASRLWREIEGSYIFSDIWLKKNHNPSFVCFSESVFNVKSLERFVSSMNIGISLVDNVLSKMEQVKVSQGDFLGYSAESISDYALKLRRVVTGYSESLKALHNIQLVQAAPWESELEVNRVVTQLNCLQTRLMKLDLACVNLGGWTWFDFFYDIKKSFLC